MEEHAIARNLQQSREEIRELLMPGASTGHAIPGHFPRSAVMRFLMDSRKRGLAVAVLGTAFSVLRRKKSAGASRWPRISHALLPLLGARHR